MYHGICGITETVSYTNPIQVSLPSYYVKIFAANYNLALLIFLQMQRSYSGKDDLYSMPLWTREKHGSSAYEQLATSPTDPAKETLVVAG